MRVFNPTHLASALPLSMMLIISCQRATPPARIIEDVPVAAEVVMENRYPEVQTLFPGGVTGLPDLVYAQLPGFRPLRLDLPPDTGSLHPMVMYIHGGGFLTETLDHKRYEGTYETETGNRSN